MKLLTETKKFKSDLVLDGDQVCVMGQTEDEARAVLVNWLLDMGHPVKAEMLVLKQVKMQHAVERPAKRKNRRSCE